MSTCERKKIEDTKGVIGGRQCNDQKEK